MHGTNTPESDRDEMGLCIEPPSCVIGLEHFEQYQYRSAATGVRSGADDVEGTIYSLRKWTRLAAAGNPSLLLLAFVNEANIIQSTYPAPYAISSVRDLLLSRECGRKFLGYLNAQKEQMLGLRSKHTNRPELVDIYGYDTKFAYHALRLGMQGIELLETGSITLPIPEPQRSHLRDVRAGLPTRQYILDEIDAQAWQLAGLTKASPLPDKPDYAKINSWLTRTYQVHWEVDRIKAELYPSY